MCRKSSNCYKIKSQSKKTILMFGLGNDESVGNWNYFKDMAYKLSGFGYKVIYISHNKKSGNKRHFFDNNIEVFRIRSFFIFQNPIELIDVFNKIFKNNKIDLIYDTTSGTCLHIPIIKIYLILTHKKIPIVLHVLGELKIHIKSVKDVICEITFNIITRLNYRFSDQICAAGEKAYNRLIKLRVKNEKLNIVYLGLHYENLFFNRGEKTTNLSKLREELSINKEDFVVGYVGRIDKGKGLMTLFKAVSQIQNIPELKLLIVGEGEWTFFKNSLKELNIYNKTIYTGFRSDVFDLMKIMDVFVNLSYSEAGINATQIEAMSLSKASIITPFTDLLKDKVDAIIVPFDDPKSVVDAINIYYNDKELRGLIGKNAYKKSKSIIKLYSWKNYIDKMNLIFNKLIENSE